jgi:N-acetylglucosaminyl-diphospho-decaprenol L-rhamnosyltransferase
LRAADRPDVEVRQSGGNLGYGRAANIGVADALTDWVVVANPDVAWTPGSLDTLIAAAQRWPSGGALGPAILTPDGSLYPSARQLPSLGRGIGHALLGWWWPTNPWTRAYRTEGGDPVEGPTGWLSGSCLLLRTSAFRQVGGFDPGYFMYFEDLDLCERLGRAGWRSVYVPSAVVSHIGAHSTERHRIAMVREHHRSAYRYLSRKYAGPWWLPLRLMLRAGLAVRSGLSRLIARIGAGARPTREATALPATRKSLD